MTQTLVARLVDQAARLPNHGDFSVLLTEAADTIESLTQRVDALETALEPLANLDDANMHDPLSKWITISQIKDAVAALKHPGDR